MVLDDTDKQILMHIRSNARQSVSQISANLNMPVSTTLSRLQKIEKNVIRKYTTLLNFEKMRMLVRVNFAIKTGDPAGLAMYLMEHGNINSLYRLGKGHDLYAEGVFSDMKQLYDFSESLNSFDIKNIEEHYIIEDIKREAFMSGENSPETRKD